MRKSDHLCKQLAGFLVTCSRNCAQQSRYPNSERNGINSGSSRMAIVSMNESETRFLFCVIKSLNSSLIKFATGGDEFHVFYVVSVHHRRQTPSESKLLVVERQKRYGGIVKIILHSKAT